MDGVEVAKGQGLLHGLVVDSAVRPVQGASVAYAGNGEEGQLTTGDDGVFAVAVAPGAYRVDVSKAGYFGFSTAATVAEGQDAAPIQILLEVDASTRAFVESFVFSGFIMCGAHLVLVTPATCVHLANQGLGNDNSRAVFEFGNAAPDWFQTEMVWKSTQPLGETLRLMVSDCSYVAEFQGLGCRLNTGGLQGRSPLMDSIDASGTFASGQLDPIGNVSGWLGVRIAAQPGDVPATQPPVRQCLVEFCAEGVGLALQQSFDVFGHAFHKYTPPPGWRFSEDSEVPQPP